jgi:hypothetical protein
VFAGLTFIKADGSKHAFATIAKDSETKAVQGAVFLRLHGGFSRLAGTLNLGDKGSAVVVFHNSPEYRSLHPRQASAEQVDSR